jgi:DNA-binding MarR family transcriptional regulator
MGVTEELQETAEGLERLALWIRAASRASVSATTMTALDTLAREGAMRVSDLAAREGITQPGMTTLVNRLTEAGWAEKLADDTDRRATLVRITADGRRALAERRAARAGAVLAGLTQLEPEHQAALAAAREALDALVRIPVNAVGASL